HGDLLARPRGCFPVGIALHRARFGRPFPTGRGRDGPGLVCGKWFRGIAPEICGTPSGLASADTAATIGACASRSRASHRRPRSTKTLREIAQLLLRQLSLRSAIQFLSELIELLRGASSIVGGKLLARFVEPTPGSRAAILFIRRIERAFQSFLQPLLLFQRR